MLEDFTKTFMLNRVARIMLHPEKMGESGEITIEETWRYFLSIKDVKAFCDGKSSIIPLGARVTDLGEFYKAMERESIDSSDYDDVIERNLRMLEEYKTASREERSEFAMFLVRYSKNVSPKHTLYQDIE